MVKIRIDVTSQCEHHSWWPPWPPPHDGHIHVLFAATGFLQTLFLTSTLLQRFLCCFPTPAPLSQESRHCEPSPFNRPLHSTTLLYLYYELCTRTAFIRLLCRHNGPFPCSRHCTNTRRFNDGLPNNNINTQGRQSFHAPTGGSQSTARLSVVLI